MARDRRARVHPAAVAAWLLFVAALVVVPRVTPDAAAVRDALVGLGGLAPAALVLAEAAQVVIIPIPGQPLEIPAGYLFGFAAGSALASAGAVAGSIAAFRLGRRYGRPWVEARVSPGTRARFERWVGRGHRAGWAIFWLMLVPAFPRDPLCYLAGLTGLTTARFAAIAAVGRPAGLVPWVALGADGVAPALRLQLGLAAVAAAAWLGYAAFTRLARRATRATDDRPTPHGERDA